MKKALVVGVDNYPTAPLNGCLNDANSVAELLRTNADGSPNFDVRLLTNSAVTAKALHHALETLFSREAETVILYFAGHGIIDHVANVGHLITVDGTSPNWGVPLASVLQLANSSYPKIRSTVLVLDSCESGYAGEVSGLGNTMTASAIANGVTIMTACDRQGSAAEADGHGVFTSLFLEGLDGAASDVLGRVTPASLYAHVDQTLGAWEQRPVYKANVQNFITLRRVRPKVPLDVLRQLPEYFPTPNHVYRLDPSHEPDRGEESANLSHILVNPANERVYRNLQLCNRAALVVPTDHPHMWHAAVFSGGCKLTPTGLHYHRLAERGRIQ